MIESIRSTNKAKDLSIAITRSLCIYFIWFMNIKKDGSLVTNVCIKVNTIFWCIFFFLGKVIIYKLNGLFKDL